MTYTLRLGTEHLHAVTLPEILDSLPASLTVRAGDHETAASDPVFTAHELFVALTVLGQWSQSRPDEDSTWKTEVHGVRSIAIEAFTDGEFRPALLVLVYTGTTDHAVILAGDEDGPIALVVPIERSAPHFAVSTDEHAFTQSALSMLESDPAFWGLVTVEPSPG